MCTFLKRPLHFLTDVKEQGELSFVRGPRRGAKGRQQYTKKVALSKCFILGNNFMFPICRSSWWDFFLPVTVYEWLWTGKYGHEHCLGLLAFYTIIWVGPLTLGSFGWELYLIYSGMTPHEINKSEKIS